MALTKSISWNSFEIPTAYKSIRDFDVTKNGVFKVNVHCNVYKDSTKDVCLYGENSQIEIPYNNGEVTFADIYTEIKKLPENTGWEDC